MGAFYGYNVADVTVKSDPASLLVRGTGSVTTGTTFTWTIPAGSHKSEVQNNFTLVFYIANDSGSETIEANVHFGWAEVHVRFAGQGWCHPSSATGAKTVDNTVIVGQHVEAKLVYDSSYALIAADNPWSTTGGAIVKDYVTNDSEGYIVEHGPSDIYHWTQFDYYYTNKAANTSIGTISKGSCIMSDPHGFYNNVTVSASFYLETLVASMTATQIGAQVTYKENHGMIMGLGITFNATITAPDINGDGEVNFLQTVVTQRDRSGPPMLPDTNLPNPPQEISSHGAIVLDNRIPYGNPDPWKPQTWMIDAGQTLNSTSSSPKLKTEDTPWEQLNMEIWDENGDTIGHYTTYSVVDSFTMYLIYKPNGTGSIWVPLQQLSWTFDAIANYSEQEYKWNLNDNSTYDSGSIPVTVLPTWSANGITILIEDWKNKSC